MPPQLPSEKLFDLAKLTGGVAVLVLFAVFLSGSGLKISNLVAAAVCSNGGGIPCDFGNGTIAQFTIANTNLTEGQSTTITWAASPTVASSIKNIACFGDGASTCGGSVQSITHPGSGGFNKVVTYYNQYTGAWYLFAPDSTNPGNVHIYKWMSSGTGCTAGVGGWGNDTACNSPYQTIGVSTNQGYGITPYAIDASTFVLAVEMYPNAGGNWTIRIYRWTAGGSANCPAGGGFGSGVNCTAGASLQTITTTANVANNYLYRAPAIATYSGTTVGMFGKELRQWFPTATGAPNGCFSGTSANCTGTIKTPLAAEPYFMKAITFATSPTTFATSAVTIMQPLLALANGTNGNLSLYPWNPTLPNNAGGNGCYGWRACWEALPNTTGFASDFVPFVNVSTDYGMPVTIGFGLPIITADDGTESLAFGHADVSASNWVYTTYNWIPSVPCLGSNGVCSVTTPVTTNTYTTNQISVVNSQFINIYPPFTAPDGPSYLNSTPVYTNGATVQKPLSMPCFGSGSTCNSAVQTFSNSAYGFYTTDSNNPNKLRYFKPLGDTNDYLALAAFATSSTPEIYKWMASCNSGQGGLGNGTTCGVIYQKLSDPTEIFDTDVATSSTGNTTLLIETDKSGGATKVYKWTTSGTGCPASGASPGWGNGTVCGSTLQTLPAGEFVKTFSLPGAAANPYVAITDTSDTGGIHLYKWMTSGPAGAPCFGNATTCGVSYQDFGASTLWPRAMDLLISGATSYLVVASDNNQSTVFKWLTSGTGCTSGAWGGTTCSQAGSPATDYYQKFDTGLDATGVDVYNFSGTIYVALIDHYYDSPSRIYKWTTTGSAPCTTGGGLGNGTLCSSGSTYLQEIYKYYSHIVNTTSGSRSSAVFIPSGTDLYLVYGGYFTRNSVLGGGGDGGSVRILKYLSTQNCFGNASVCDSATVDSHVQRFEQANRGGAEYLPIGNGFLATGNLLGPSNLYVFSPTGGATPTCSLLAHDSNGTTTVSNSNNGTNVSTGILSETTDYTVDCDGVGSARQTITVTAPVTTPTATITATDPTATEGSSPTTGMFTISLDVASTSPVPMLYTITAGGSNAVNGTDYTRSTTSPVTIAANQTSATITITPIDDSIFEGNENVTFTLSANGNYIVGSPSSASVVISDDENSSSLPPATFNSCTIATAGCELLVTPGRIRKGNTVGVSWNVLDVVSGANGNTGNTCSITSTPSVTGTGFPPTFALDSSNDWIGSATNITINQPTTFTLRCVASSGATKSTSQSIQLIPGVQEI